MTERKYNCRTIPEALAGITTMAELDGFTSTLRNPPAGATTKQPTTDDWQAIARRRAELAKG